MGSPFGMRVPDGGSNCAKCKYINRATMKHCAQKDFIAWDGSKEKEAPKPAGSNIIPIDANTYCCNKFEIGSQVQEGTKMHPYTDLNAEHHDDGTITAELLHQDGKSHVTRGMSSIDELHDFLEEHLRGLAAAEEFVDKLVGDEHPDHKEQEGSE